MDQPPVATPISTIKEILRRSKRPAVPIRKTFVQQLTGSRRGGPLARLVRNHDERALELYLLILAAASGGDYDVSHAAAVWARALYLQGKSGPSAVSKALARLVRHKLVAKTRARGKARVILMMEDGSEEPYTRPSGKRLEDRFLQLPNAYWLEDWNRKLSLPAKAALLIASSLPNDFVLPGNKAPDWYGISEDTIEEGLRELRQNGLITRQRVYKEAPLTPQGFTTDSHYTLKPPFGPHPSREKAQVAEILG